MFRSIAFLAGFAASQSLPPADKSTAPSDDSNVVDPDASTKIGCQIIASFSYFDLSPLMKETGNYVQGPASWNFCKYATVPDGYSLQEDTFAFVQDLALSTIQAYTDSGLYPSHTDANLNGGMTTVSFVQTSDQQCSVDDSGEAINYQFAATVQCEESITGQGEAQILSVDFTTDPCTLSVSVAHNAGCPTVDGMGFAQFMEDYPWIMGIVYIACGPIIALFGKRWFPWVVAIFVSVFTFLAALMLFSVFGWMAETVGLIICIIVALGLGIFAFWFVKRTVWLQIGVLGGIGGFFLGTLCYSLIYACTGWDSLWFMIILGVICAVVGGFVSYKCSKQLVLFATSGIGSYIFVRGWAYFFGGWAGVGEMMSSIANGEDIDITWAFWIYFAIFVGCFIGSMCFQIKKGSDHPDLQKDEYYNRAG